MDLSSLSKHDVIATLDIIHELVFVDTTDNLSLVFEKSKKILPFGKSLFGFAVRPKKYGAYSNKILNSSYPLSWLEEYSNNEYHLIDPVYKHNMQIFGLQRWSDTYKKNPPTKSFLKSALSYELSDGYTFGLPGKKNHFASLFSISGVDLEFNNREKIIIEALFPHLHFAIEKATSNTENSKSFYKPFLTNREIEIIKWLMDGKSTWDIGSILNISENTVKYHIKNLMNKFDVFNRVHLVAVAISMKLFA